MLLPLNSIKTVKDEDVEDLDIVTNTEEWTEGEIRCVAYAMDEFPSKLTRGVSNYKLWISAVKFTKRYVSILTDMLAFSAYMELLRDHIKYDELFRVLIVLKSKHSISEWVSIASKICDIPKKRLRSVWREFRQATGPIFIPDLMNIVLEYADLR